MRKPTYEPLPVFTSEEQVQAIVDSGSVEDLMVLSLAIGEHWPDWRYAQNLCLGLANHADERVRANACLAFAYIARTKGQLDRISVEDVLIRELRGQTDLQWRIVDAIGDINVYLKWNLTPMLPGDALELGLYRALRGEIQLGIRVSAQSRFASSTIPLRSWFNRREGEFDARAFELVVVRELDRHMPPLFWVPDDLSFIYESIEAFDPECSERVLIDNP